MCEVIVCYVCVKLLYVMCVWSYCKLSVCVWSYCSVKLLYVKFVCVKFVYVKLLYVKFVCVKLLYVKFVCVKFVCVKLCMLSLCVLLLLLYVWGRRREKVPEEKAPGIRNQKQEPHTKMWGMINHL